MSKPPAELVLLSSGELVFQGQSSQRISLDRMVTTIGRDYRRADIAVQKVEMGGENFISSIHCTILYEEHEDRYYIIDNNSTNGTLLNGKSLPSGTRVLLNDADVIGLSVIRQGGVILRFYLDPPAAQDIRRTEPLLASVPPPERDPETKPTRPVDTGQLNPDILTMQHSIFVSYCHEDLQVMRRMVKTLQEDYYLKTVEFWTDEHLKVGTPSWSRKIEEAIENADALIAILTPYAKRSEWIDKEITYAQAHHVRIFPVLADTDETASVPITLIHLQRVAVAWDFQMGMQRLSNDIYQHLRQLEHS